MGDTGYISRLICLPPHPFLLLVHVHTPVEFLLHFIEEIGAAVVLSQFDVGIDAVAVLGFHVEQRIEESGKFSDLYFTVIDTAHLRYAVEDFNEVGGFTRPTQGRDRCGQSVVIVGLRI